MRDIVAQSAPHADQRRDVWLPEFHQTMVEVMGQEWPDLIIEKWERNGIGETRFVESRFYGPKDAR